MALSAPGIGSNLDINSIISGLMQVESRPLTALSTREAAYQSKLSAYGAIKGALSTFHTAVLALKDATRFTGLKATSSDAAIITGSAASSAVAGSYAIDVSTLAKPQIQAANTKYADTTSELGLSGDLVFTVGSDSFTVTVGATDSLQDIAAAINEAADNAGVQASIVNDGGSPGNRLVIAASESGTANSVVIDDSGLSASFAFGETQPAQDLSLSINGIPVTQSSNKLENAIEGLTLNVAGEGAATITVARDEAAAKSAVDGFVKAYNDLNKVLKDLSAYNAETSRAAVLQGESSVRTIQTQLRSVLTAAVDDTATYHTLSQLGISFELDGSLKLDATKFSDALSANLADATAFFSGSGLDGAPLGLATRLDTLTSNLLGTSGIINTATEGLNRSIKDIDNRREALNQRLLDIEERYRRQFTALDTLISSLNQTSAFLQQQLANLPTTGSN